MLYGVPEWAARRPAAASAPNIGPRSRPITDEGLRGYRRLVRDLRGARPRPRASSCSCVDARGTSPTSSSSSARSGRRATTSAPSLAPGVYTRFVRALRDELPDGAQLVLGELAGVDGPTPRATGIGEFVARAAARRRLRRPTCGRSTRTPSAARSTPGREGPVGQLRARARPPRVHARQADLGHRDRRRRRARGRRARRQRRARCAPAAATLHRQLRRWHRDAARRRRLPVHVPRGPRVPASASPTPG